MVNQNNKRGAMKNHRRILVGAAYLGVCAVLAWTTQAMGQGPGDPGHATAAPPPPANIQARPIAADVTVTDAMLRNAGKARWEDMGPPSLRRKLFPDLPVEGRNRLRLLELTGKVQVPYLVDANTGTALYESDDIMRYLERQYGR